MKRIGFLLGIFLTVSAVYFSVVSSSRLITYDDPIGVAPLEKVDSWATYRQLRESYIIIDVLPLRDFTVWLDYRISSFFNWPTFHLSNFLLWIGTLFFLFKIFEHSGVPLWLGSLFVVYCGVHPVAVNSVAWVTGRKHLLAVFFVAGATYFWRKALKNSDRKNRSLTLVFYFLACLSHPVTGFWPAWAAYTYWKSESRKKTLKIPLFVLCGLGLVLLAVNYYYYSSPDFVAVNGTSKMEPESFKLLISRILVIGRYFYQLLLPEAPSVISYDDRNWRNFVGTALLIPLIILVLRSSKKEIFKYWGIFCLMPLLTVTIKPSNIIGMDTYAITTLIGWSAFWCYMFWEGLSERLQFTGKFILVAIVAVSAWHSRSQAALWLDETALWKVSADREPTATSFIFHANMLLMKKDPDAINEALKLTLKAKELAPHHTKLGFALCKSVYFNRYLNNAEKERILEENFLEDPWFIYCYASLKAMVGKVSEGTGWIQKLWDFSPQGFVLTFGTEVSAIATDWYVMCKKSGQVSCLEKFMAVRQKAPIHFWNDQIVQDKLRSFRMTYPPN